MSERDLSNISTAKYIRAYIILSAVNIQYAFTLLKLEIIINNEKKT